MGKLRKKSTSTHPLHFMMVQSADHVSPLTGATPTVTISKDGGAFATPAGAVTEIANGWYQVAGNATDTNTLGPLIVHATATGGDPCDSEFQVVAFNPDDANSLGLAGLCSNAPGSAGGMLVVGTNSGMVTFGGGMVISSSTGTALQISSFGGNGNAIALAPNGSGVAVAFGASGTNAISISANINMVGGIFVNNTTGDALSLQSSGGNGNAIRLTPNGAGTAISAGAIDLATLTAAFKQILAPRGFLVSAGVTSPVTAGVYNEDALFNNEPTYVLSDKSMTAWYDSANTWWVISAVAGTNGAAYYKTAAAGGVNSAYTPQGTATGTPIVAYRGNGVLSAFQPNATLAGGKFAATVGTNDFADIQATRAAKIDNVDVAVSTRSTLAAGAQMDLVNAPNATAVTAIQAGLSKPGTAQTITMPAAPANWLTATAIAAGALSGKGDWLLSSSYTAPDNADIVSALADLVILLGRTDPSTALTAIKAVTDKLSTTFQGTGPYAFTAAALVNAPTGSGGGGLSGPSSVTLTFRDAGGNPVQNVGFTIVGQGAGPRSNASGVSAFGMFDGTYTVVAGPVGLVLFANTTLVVSGTTALTITGTALSIAPANPGMITVTGKTIDNDGNVVPNAKVYFRVPYEPEVMVQSDGSGNVSVALLQNKTYVWRPSGGSSVYFTTTGGTTQSLGLMQGTYV